MLFTPESSCSILVVEDDTDTRDILAFLLADEGYQVTAMPNGDMALTYLHQATTMPDLILLDLLMSGMNGEGLLTAIRQHAAWRSIPVVLMSALQHIETVAERLETTGHLAKPFDVEQLLGVVQTHCALRSRTVD